MSSSDVKEDLKSADWFTEQKEENDITVLLIGKTGNGKSRTGNTIFQKDVFEYTDSSTSVKHAVKHGYVQYNNRTIKVIDCPGIEDTNTMDNIEKATSYLIETMGDVVIQHPDGYHAFLLVVRYGNRYTKEDKFVIKTLKSFFGAEILSQFSVLLMTHGDMFNTQNERNKTFEEWCSEQTGVLKELMEECGNRVVLFDNTTTDQEKLDSQMKKLIKTIDKLPSRGKRYNHEYIQRAVNNREYLLVEAKEPRILQETNEECSNISSELEKLNTESSEECIRKLEHLLNRALELKSKVQIEDNNTGALIKAIGVVDSLSKMISNLVYNINEFRQKELQLLEERTSFQRVHDERINNLQETYEEKTKDAQRLEKEKEEFEKKWLEQEERMQAILKHLLDSTESEKNAQHRKIEELENKCRETKAEANSQVQEHFAVLQSSINNLMERKTKEKVAFQDEINSMKKIQMDKQKEYNDVKEDLYKAKKNFLMNKMNIITKFESEIDSLKIKEKNLIKEKEKLNYILIKERDAYGALMTDYTEKTGTMTQRVKNVCAIN